jgi:hypothetical protein
MVPSEKKGAWGCDWRVSGENERDTPSSIRETLLILMICP